jgi:hypothetical protein
LVGEFPERVLDNLYARKRQILNSFMNHRTAEHASGASDAFFAVIDQITLGNGVIGFGCRGWGSGCCHGRSRGTGCDQRVHRHNRSAGDQKISSGEFLFGSSFSAFSFFAFWHRLTPSLL